MADPNAVPPGTSVIDDDSKGVTASDADVAFLTQGADDKPVTEDKSKETEEAITEEQVEKTEEELAAEALGTEEEELTQEEETAEEAKAVDSAEFNKLKEAYPDLPKKFPWVRKAVFEHAHYQSILPTIDDAKEAVAMRDAHELLGKSLLEGRPEILFNSLHDQDPKSVERLAQNFLPVLRQGNQELYNRTVEPIIKNLLREVKAHGEKIGNKNLSLASQHITNLIFGVTDLPDDKPTVNPELEEREQKLENRERELESKEHSKFFRDVNHQCGDWLNREIEKGLDPNKAMTGLVKQAAVKYIKDQIHEVLIGDKIHQNRIASLYREAKREGFPPEWSERIFSAYLGRVKPLLPALRQKARAEALGDKLEKTPEKGAPTKPENKRVTIPPSGLPKTSEKGKVPDANKIDWRKTSDEDFLKGNITLKN
jgi:hypothetical protein